VSNPVTHFRLQRRYPDHERNPYTHFRTIRRHAVHVSNPGPHFYLQRRYPDHESNPVPHPEISGAEGLSYGDKPIIGQQDRRHWGMGISLKCRGRGTDEH